MGQIKEQLIKEELAKPFEVGKCIRVKGKYLNYNTSQDPEWVNTLKIKEVKEEEGKTVIYAEHGEWRSYARCIERVVVEDNEVQKSTSGIGANPIPAEHWDAHVRRTGFDVSNVINRIKNDIESRILGKDYVINGIVIPELNLNPFVYGKDGNRLYYQRDYCWTVEDEQNFIESMYNHLNLGTVVFRKRSWKWLEKETATRGDNKDNSDLGFYDVVDGKQRIHTLMRFMTDQFTDKHGNLYSDLSDFSQRKFEDCGAMTVMEIEEEASEEDVLRVFLNVNYTGRPMSQEHLDYVRSEYLDVSLDGHQPATLKMSRLGSESNLAQSTEADDD